MSQRLNYTPISPPSPRVKSGDGDEVGVSFKETKSVTMNIFRKKKKIFSFYIICKSRIKLCFHNKNVEYS